MLKFPRIADPCARTLLAAAVSIGVILTLLHASFSVAMYRDSANVYAAMARSLAEGDFAAAFHPGIPSLHVLLSWGFLACGVPPERALSLVSGLFYVATVPVLFLLLRSFIPERPAAIGTLLFVCAPKIIRFSCCALLDSGKIFFLVAALFFLYKLVRERFHSPLTGLAFGAALGGLSLARSESIGLAVFLAGCAAVYFGCQAVRRKKLPPLLSAAATAAAWGGFIVSRVLLMRWATGEFVYDRRIENGLARLAGNLFACAPVPASDAAASAAAAAPKVSWLYLINQSIRGGYELYLVFTAIGLLLCLLATRWKGCGRLYPARTVPEGVKWNGFFYVLLLTTACNMLIFKASDIAAYRYFLPGIPLLMVFTVTGFAWLWRWGEKFVGRPVLAVLAAGVLLLQAMNGADCFFSEESRRQYACGRRIGEMLHAETNPGKVWFHEASVEWYYSGMRRACPIESSPPGGWRAFSDFDYVLWSPNEPGMEIIASRGDLREIALPEGADVRLFERVK